MPSDFPASLDNIPTNKINETISATDHPTHHNFMASAINAVETVVKPIYDYGLSRASTFIIAASNSSDKAKSGADSVCSGTNDQVDIQAAIDALPTGGGKILLLAGEYSISSQMLIDKGRVTIEGEGWGFWNQYVGGNPGTGTEGMGKTKLKATSSLTDPCMFKMQSGSGGRTVGIHFNGLYLYGYNYLRTGIWCNDGSDQITIENVFIHRFEHGMNLDSDSAHVRGCTVMDVSGMGIGLYGYQGSAIDCCIYDIGGTGLQMDATGAIAVGNTVGRCNRGFQVRGHGCIVIGNHVVTNRLNNIELFNTNDTIVEGNIIWFDGTTTDSGIWIGGDFGIGSNRCIIVNNSIKRLTTNVGPDTAIKLVSPSFSGIISGNIISTPDGGGFEITALNIEPGTNYKVFNNYSDLFMDTKANVPNHIVNIEDLTQSVPITCTLVLQPDVARNITLTITDGDTSITAFNITVLGTDAKGNTASEIFTQVGGLLQTGSVAFAIITSVIVNSIVGDNAGDTLSVGIGSKLGLTNSIDVAGGVYKVKKNNTKYPSASYTVNTTYDTVDVSTGEAINDGDDFTILYKSDLNLIVTI